MLGLPLRAFLEKVLPRLSLAPALPTLGGGSILHLLEVLPREVMPCLDLVGPQGKPLRTPGYRTVRPLALRSVLFTGGSASSPLPCLRPFLFRDLLLEVRERST